VIFTETALHGAWLIKPEPIEDERGHFARVFCMREFLDHGLNTTWVQCNTSFNRIKGTVRGMHFQVDPGSEIKTVSCMRGEIHDVIVDLRADSPSRGQWYACRLTEENQHVLYIPEGCAHGFQTLTDKASVFYQMSQFHLPECARGVRWDDPAFNIQWPVAVASISTRDMRFPLFVP
jgi:dTDP-4-dehydrorhamnose 3,5-epimerase